MTKADHEHLARLFIRASARYLRRRDHWLALSEAGLPAGRARLLADQAVRLVARLGTRHPLAPLVDSLWAGDGGPLHRRDE